MAIPRMRTAARVLEEIKKLDPETELSLHYVKMMIHDEVVPVLHVGNKKLVNVDDVIAYLQNDIPQKPKQEEQRSLGIRRVV